MKALFSIMNISTVTSQKHHLHVHYKLRWSALPKYASAATAFSTIEIITNAGGVGTYNLWTFHSLRPGCSRLRHHV